jgi:hypothetical protein
MRYQGRSLHLNRVSLIDDAYSGNPPTNVNTALGRLQLSLGSRRLHLL